MAEKNSKKAVIASGGKQYLVTEDQELEVELLGDEKSVSFDALLLIDGAKVSLGKPIVSGVSVKADITEQVVKGDKVTAIRFKAKKRVHKRRGHRQRHTLIKIKSIGVKT